MGPLRNVVASEEADLVAVAFEVLPSVGASGVLPSVEGLEVLALVEALEVLRSEVLPLVGASGALASAQPRLALGSAAEQSRGPTGLPRCRPSRDAAGNSSMRDGGGLRLPLCVGIVREHRPKAAGNKPEITKGHSGA